MSDIEKDPVNPTPPVADAGGSVASSPASPSSAAKPESGVPETASAPAPGAPAAAEAVVAPRIEDAPVAPATIRNTFVAAYEHPTVVRFCHWLNAITLTIMILSGLRIFMAFPSFGPRIPEHKLLNIPAALTLGGWLGGALQWHLTFMWIFALTGLVYVIYEIASGHYKTVLFRPRDIPGVWPMVRHYFLFGPDPPQTEAYNPLQKLAYTTAILCGALSLITGMVIYKPTQLSGLAWLMGGFHWARVWHFAAMCGFLAFIPGHLVMVALHGWNNFRSMLSGWKREPEYLTPEGRLRGE